MSGPFLTSHIGSVLPCVGGYFFFHAHPHITSCAEDFLQRTTVGRYFIVGRRKRKTVHSGVIRIIFILCHYWSLPIYIPMHIIYYIVRVPVFSRVSNHTATSHRYIRFSAAAAKITLYNISIYRVSAKLDRRTLYQNRFKKCAGISRINCKQLQISFCWLPTYFFV